MPDPERTDAEPEGGDPVCWLHQLCPECGAVPTEDSPARCWRCDAPAPAGGTPARPPA